MRFHPKALLIVAAFFVLLLAAIDVRLGIAAIASAAAIDALTFLAPLVFGHGRSRRVK